MAKEPKETRVRIGWKDGMLTVAVRGFSPEQVRFADFPESIHRAAIELGINTAVRNAYAGDKESTDQLVHTKVTRKLQALRAGLWEADSAPGINWAVFPTAMALVLNENKVPVPADIGGQDGMVWSDQLAMKRLIGKPAAEQATLYQRPDVQAHVTRILAERAKAALGDATPALTAF